ncbi:MAG: hypothetical protein GWO16_03760, partial [Gammaproteobacteria bacterium]|nr:hypothetical protein [Gammaproteobacteria bacterium]
KVLASRKARVNFRQFEGLDDATFLARVFHLIAKTVEASRRQGEDDPPFTVALDKAPAVESGVLALDLSDVDTFGAPDRVPFQLRRERGAWLTYTTDTDRRKSLLLPVGNYYLKVADRVRNAFTIT